MTDHRVSENSSQKGRRGRPPLLDRETDQELRRRFPKIRSRRSLADTHYELLAINALGSDLAFAWLLSGGVRRKTILAELGRLRDPEHIRRVAAWVCEATPTTRRAIAFVRDLRLGERPVDVLALTQTMATAFDRYRSLHRGLTKQQALEALQELRDLVEAPDTRWPSEDSGADGH